MSETSFTDHQFAIVNADKLVVNRIAWSGQGDIWLFEGECYVLDDASTYPIGATYTGSVEPSSAAGYYPAPSNPASTVSGSSGE